MSLFSSRSIKTYHDAEYRDNWPLHDIFLHPSTTGSYWKVRVSFWFALSGMPYFMRFGCQNVRSLLDLPTKKNFPGAPPRQTGICNNEFRSVRTEVIALSESPLPNQGSYVEKNYTFFWSGQPTNVPRYGGVGFVISNNLVKFMTDSPHCFNSRIMSIRLKLTKSLKAITFISVYAPTFKAKVSVRNHFTMTFNEPLTQFPQV